MAKEIITSIVTSCVAFIAAIISLIISRRSLRMQKKINDSGKQIDYLQKKIILLEEAKSELASIDYMKTELELSNKDDLVTALSNYTKGILVNLPKIIQKLKGHFDNEILLEYEERINSINRLRMKNKAKEILGDEFAGSKHDDLTENDSINFVLSTKDEFKKYLIEEMYIYNKRIEKIIEMQTL